VRAARASCRRRRVELVVHSARCQHGTVGRIEGDRAVVGRNVHQLEPEDGRHGSNGVGLTHGLSGQIHTGDTVFVADHERILDVAREGFPAHADRIRSDSFPEITAFYEKMAGA